jgi:predicted acylesterase/phospholipase RssA
MGCTDTGTTSEDIKLADRFLTNESIPFKELDDLWQNLTQANEVALARMVLERMLDRQVSIGISSDQANELCRQLALWTSKDVELNAAIRHDLAIRLLKTRFPLDEPKLDGDSETLGIAGGICKRKWYDLGQFADLQRAAEFYARGAKGDLGKDAYTQINAAFLDDVLASVGDDDTGMRRERARKLRERIVKELDPIDDDWWNAASLAEAYVGLGRYEEATAELKRVTKRPALWKLQTAAQQLAHLAQLHDPDAFNKDDVRAFFTALLPGSNNAINSVSIGKVGLALSGGGFRASFFHLGVLAFLAERDVLRHIDVLSCVSGGSIVGASYWLALRARLEKSREVQPVSPPDYVDLVQKLIATFQKSVAGDLRRQVQPSIFGLICGLLNGMKGAMDPEKTGRVLEQLFYRPDWKGSTPIYLHDLPFTPADHSPELTGSTSFNPARHNWLRTHKVPALILNATTVNTGHAWQFTTTWMGEAPWSIYDTADSISRLQWSNYNKRAGWQIELGRAVAASACVPGVFSPLQLPAKFTDNAIRVSLVDGGVFDNQGTVSLLASNCNVLLVSDACGQLMLEKAPPRGLFGLAKHAMRAMDTLMERVRLANFGDLEARLRSGLLRGLMFLHMKAGLDADVIRLDLPQRAFRLDRAPRSPSGLRKDFQQALAELRTDLDDFSLNESTALMACGYQMALKNFDNALARFEELSVKPTKPCNWPFEAMRSTITSTDALTADETKLLEELRQGNRLRNLMTWPALARFLAFIGVRTHKN